MKILDILENDNFFYKYDFYKDFKKSSYYEKLIDSYKNLNTKILYKSNIHGQDHIERVMFFAFVLSYHYKLNDADTEILRYAAALHDTQRVSDSFDTEHGYRAAIYSIKYAPINSDDKKILQAVLASHSRNDEDMDSTIKEFDVNDFQRAKYLSNIFKDCDGLDRVRLPNASIKYGLDPRYLRNDFSLKLVNLAHELFNAYKK